MKYSTSVCSRSSQRRYGLFAALLFCALGVTACNRGTPIYRAEVKLLVTTAGTALPTSDVVREDDGRFFETQKVILQSATIIHRAQQRLNLSVPDTEKSLVGMDVRRVGGSDIMLIAVDSPSETFARDFANALAQEYLKFRDEQRVQTSESALLKLTQEVRRLSDELKGVDSRIAKIAEEEHTTPETVLEKSMELRDEREQLRSLHNALLAQLMKLDVTQNFSARNVMILEPAIVRPARVH